MLEIDNITANYGPVAALKGVSVRVEQAELVTIGCPRVGNAEFGGVFEGRQARRYVGTVDLVTRVPPELLGFRHVGEERHIGSSGLNDFVFDRNLLFDQLTTPINVLADHAPINYVEMV